jgi:bacterioferritin
MGKKSATFRPDSPRPTVAHFNIAEIRKSAREHVDNGAITENYEGDKSSVIEMLGAALATEWVCVLRYTQHQIAATGIHADAIASHFAEHAEEEQRHAMELAIRIRQLGGVPSLDPAAMSALSHSEYKECDSLSAMIMENLVSERVAIQTYTEMIRILGDSDTTTKRMLEGILADEEEHADELAGLIQKYDQAQTIPRRESTSTGSISCQIEQ